MARKQKGKIGSSFDDFLADEGILQEVTEAAIKRVLARQIAAFMEDQSLSKTAMATAMSTSRAALDRLLDPENTSITLATMQKAAKVLGKRVEIDLVDAE